MPGSSLKAWDGDHKMIKKFFSIILLTFLIAVVWNLYPDLFFKPPESFSIGLTKVFAANHAESIADVELIYTFSLSFIFSLIIHALIYLVGRKSRNAEPSDM